MGYILDKINTKLPKALDGKLGDAVEPFTATRTVQGEYDPVTGTTTGSTETWQGRWIKASWRLDQVDDQHIRRNDVKRLVMQSETGWQPAIDDEVNGLTVVDVSQDPAAALWILNLRRT